uniref:Uncharacterized protein n=1 Tax=Pseudomonas phage HRDY3 TaxID=3236930 RepID=A0AB39CE46_9VIRU
MDIQGLHRLLSRLELAYYSALSRDETPEEAAQRLRNAADNAICLETIPRSLFDYAEALAAALDPLKLLEDMRQMFR